MSPIKVREFLTVKRFEVRELSENQLVKNDKKSEKSPILVREKKKKSIVYPSPRKVREWKFLGQINMVHELQHRMALVQFLEESAEKMDEKYNQKLSN